ncbi:hypothetical protein GCM10010218_63300 [Streptomyces mashuensis]|uniref:Integral membrane protein n=1 Tax=Streptomyces mashuensis TaxID=33904 RepID=A0A919B8X6_9ACTN|nr:hypothetical protein [Streptomyces mashuensis]GHF73451.1 hypothetical protein GCM10010218_63300 [Streptomyces mashuensis]
MDGLERLPAERAQEARSGGAAGPRETLPAAYGRLGRPVLSGALLLLAVLLLFVVVRLPWSGDLGMHAAVLERLRADPLHPGNPLVDRDTPSPYYSPWTLFQALAARATGWGTFRVLRVAGLAGLLLLGTGVAAFVRTFSRARGAVALALLCVLFLYGVRLFAWSGVPALTSLALTVAYPSTFALGLCLHVWALLRRALAGRWTLRGFLGTGALLALVLLVHQFTGAVAVLGSVAMLLGARPVPDRALWWRTGAAALLTGTVVLCWPYYPFTALLGGGGLDLIHRPLYAHLPQRLCLLAPGAAALVARWRRDRRDPLALLCAGGALVFAAGGLSGHYAWGRVLPAVVLPAQTALAVEVAEAVRGRRDGTQGERARRGRGAAVRVAVTAVALLAGAWTQAGVLSYVVHREALPPPLRQARAPALWPGFRWAAARVPKGQTVMTDDYVALRALPAYGPYTVAPAYPDLFLPDEARRREATRRYYAPDTTRAERLAILEEYGARWVLQKSGRPGLPADDPALRRAARGPSGLTLWEVVRPDCCSGGRRGR